MIQLAARCPTMRFVPYPQSPPTAYELPTIDAKRCNLGVKIMLGSRQLPMPNVTRVTSLSQAHATLQHCWAKLSTFVQDHSPSTSAPASSAVVEERQRFQSWLAQWEAAFTAFLTNAMATMNNEDITQSRILKTNHLACTILASDAQTLEEAFEAEFKAIIELSSAVVRSRYSVPDSPLSTKSSTAEVSAAPTTAGLDVFDPLMVVISRCKVDTVRTRAAELIRVAPR